ncbi:hypothetical protein AY599_02405 [Leptolyngbya valderiana BDU 20041]|nr:hypothetical protein AY599_02405 [Leptolyngbya valderiana BDU 20041]
MLKQGLIILSAASLLMACSQEPEAPEPTEAEATPSPEVAESPASETPALEEIASDPDALREAMRDPEQRDALMQAMRERRQARLAEREGEDGEANQSAMREQMRERRAQMMAERSADGTDPRQEMRERMLERSRWWTNDDLQATMGLSEAQSEALTAAQLQLEERRQTLRQSLGQNQRDLMEAATAADRDRMLALIEQRSIAQQTLQEMEMEWWRTLIDELSDEQLAILAEQNPQILLRRGGR